jgi:hypothetical protein
LPAASVATPAPANKITNADILGWFNANPNADAALIAKTMQDANVNSDQLSDALKGSTKAATQYLTAQILSQGTTDKWKGEGKGSAQKNAEDMAKIIAETGATNINQFGKITKTVDAAVQPIFESGDIVGYDENGPIYTQKIVGYVDQDGKPVDPKLVKTETVYGGESGSDQTVYIAPVGKQEVFGNKLTGQEVASTYGERQTGNAFGGTFDGKGNTGYRVQFGADGTPIFYTTQATSNDLAILMQDLGPIGQIGLALATGGLSIPQQIAAQLAVNVLSGKDIGDAVKSAAISFAGAQIPGMDFMKDGASFIKDLGLSADLTKTLTNSFQNAAVSAGTALLSGQDVGEAMTKGFVTGGVNGAVNSLLGNIEEFKDLTANQKKLVTNAVTGVISGKPLDQIAINTAIAAANSAIADARKTTTTGSTTGSTTGTGTPAAITTLSDEDLAELQPGELTAYQNGGVQGLADFRRDMRLLTSLTTSGRTGDDTGGTGTDTTSFTNSLGTLDQLDTTRTADEYADFLRSIGITNTTQLADSGLSNQDILDLINFGTDTVTVTGDKPTPGTTETTGIPVIPVTPGTTGTTDLGTVTVVDKKCPPGSVYDETQKKCVPIVETPEITIVDKKCPPGSVYDEDLKQCVPIAKIPEITIVDKKCPPGSVYNEDLKQCVPIETVTIVDKKCPPGQVYDEDLKQCVPITETPTTPTTLTCPEGYEPNAAGTACIPVITIVDKKCPPGQVYDEDLKQCVPIVTPPVVKPPVVTPPVVKPPVVTPPVKKVEVPSFVPSAGSYVSGDRTDPIYAGPMGNFNLFATLEELLADDTDKKDNKNFKDKTKMATGGHLDDLLAEQMTVDDLLKLLR